MTSIPTSTLVYVNNIATGGQAGITANVDAVGYYYYDGTAWVKLHNPSNATFSSVNIYNTDGSLTGNRLVTQGTNTLAFSSNAVNGFSVDGTTFSVDAVNNRVGIGTASPNGQLELGQTTANRKLVLYGSVNNDNQFYGFGVNPGILRYQADALGTDHVFYAGTGATTSNELMRIKGLGSVGIGTSTPQKLLHVAGSLQVTNEFNVGGDAATAGSAGTIGQILTSGGAGTAPSWQTAAGPVNIYNTDGSLTGNRLVTQGTNTLAFSSNAVNGFSVDGNTFSVDALNNRVGVGTTTPHGQLQLGNTVVNRKIVMFETADNDNEFYGFGVNSGVMRYQADRTSTDHVFYAGITGGASSNELMRIKGTGNVGIGTSTPQKQLHVAGALQVTNELNVGGDAVTAGSAGTTGQVLVSNGAGAAPAWKATSTLSGNVTSAFYVQGTTASTIAAGATADVPGVTITLTVPTGLTQTFLFTILGYATFLDNNSSQGVFSLLQNGTKVSSAYASKAGMFPAGGTGTVLLTDMPIPVTFLKSVTLTAGTYTFKVQYSAWRGTATVNFVPSTYGGYNGDTEAMLTKMQVMVYNN